MTGDTTSKEALETPAAIVPPATIDPPAAIARVAVKAPPFWRANPDIWFRQMESQFVLANVTTETTKFHHVVASLQPEELSIVADLLKKEPGPKPYTNIRDRLCQQYAVTKEEELRDLISGMQLGDKKPSRLLLEMRGKAGTMAEDMLKSLFLQRLPPHVQQILAISTDVLEKLAEMADSIMSAASGTSVHEVRAPANASIQEERGDPSLRQMLQEITSRLDLLETRSRSRSRDAGRRNDRFRPSSRQRSSSRAYANPEHCWYHQEFGSRATNCRAPCTWVAEN